MTPLPVSLAARVTPTLPKQDRPVREGTRVASIETGLAAAAAKLAQQVGACHPDRGPVTDPSLTKILKTQTFKLIRSQCCLSGVWKTFDLYPWQYPSPLLYPSYPSSKTSYFHKLHS